VLDRQRAHVLRSLLLTLNPQSKHVKMRVAKLYFGTMNFGWSQASSRIDEIVAVDMLKAFMRHNNALTMTSGSSPTTATPCFIDTARIYAGGKTENILGAALQTLHGDSDSTIDTSVLCIGTKAHPSQPQGLSSDGIEGQISASLEAMRVQSSVGEYYLHQPDTEHDLLASLKKAHELKNQGRIKVVGMSNYHVTEMERAFALCEEHKLTKPSVYQGLYNPLNRMVETELLPLLRKHKCSFVAYNPLAAGLLTGKHKRGVEVQKGRFKNNNNYLPRFYTDVNFDAIESISRACDEAGISLVEAAYRWMLCHSALTEEDGLLIGASSMSQLEDNLAACAKAASREDGPLPCNVLVAMSDAWGTYTSKGDPFPYWRSYSADMPDRNSLDQGASYSATKK
jgi:aflatoxin B1 aldehyde reductase